MKNKLLVLSIHFLAWIFLILLSYVTTDQVFELVVPLSDAISLTPIFVFIIMMIAVCYLNYCILIPRFLFLKKYWLYFPLLLISALSTIAIPVIMYAFSDFHPEKLSVISPYFEKILPVIFANALLMLIVSIVASILLAINHRLKQTEKEKLSAQIAMLKSQINPHFLFNTLNNIYGIAIDTSPTAADMVDRLSEMMRYTMKETQKDFVALEDEINYIDNFIKLQKLRLDKSVKLEYKHPEDIPPCLIAPMLLIPFIENAFKHGVNSEQKSQIKIEINATEMGLHLVVLNNKVDVQRDIAEHSGLGIENTRHRLNLIYPSRHLLVINETDKTFSVSLHINIK